MVCAYCGGRTKVTNSRPQKRSNQVWRRRHCQRCGADFTTHEAIYLPALFSVERNGRLEPFEPDKLYDDILTALKDKKDHYTAAREVTATIIHSLVRNESGSFGSAQISQTAAKVLKRFDRQAYLRFLAEHPSLED